MLLHIPDVLTPAQARSCLDALLEAEWVDGRVTAGFQSAQVKHNRQLPEDHPVARTQGQMVGLRLGLMPVEDFAYPLFAVLLLPALWALASPTGSARAGNSGQHGNR